MKNIASNFIKHPLVSGSAVLFMGSMLGNLFNFLFNLFMSRNLPFSDYGILVSLISFITLVTLPVGAVSPTLVYFSAASFGRGELNKVRGLFNKIFLPSVMIGFIVFLIFIIFRSQIGEFFRIHDSSLMVLVGLNVFIAFVAITNGPLLQGKLAFGFLSIINSLSSFVRLVLSIFLIFLGYSIGGLLLALFISSLIPLILGFYKLRFLVDKKIIPMKVEVKNLFSYGAPSILATYALTAFITQDIILVKHFFNSESAGIYATVSLIGKVIFYFSAPISTVMFPLIAQKHSRGEHHGGDLKLSMIAVLIPSLFIILAYSLFPEFVIHIFAQKKISASTVGLLIPFSIFITFYSLVTVLTNFFLSINKTKVFIPILAASMLQGGLIWMFHDSFYQIIFMSLGVLGLLLISLLLYYFVSVHEKKDY